MLCYMRLWRYICGRVLDSMAEGEIIAICFHNSELSDCEGERAIDRNRYRQQQNDQQRACRRRESAG